MGEPVSKTLHLQNVPLWPSAYPVRLELFAEPWGEPLWSGVAETCESLVELPPRAQLGLSPEAVVGVQMTLADGAAIRHLWIPGLGVTDIPWHRP